MVDDERQRTGMFRLHVDEVDVQPIDGRDELRVGIEPRFRLAPVVVGRPVVRELLDRGLIAVTRQDITLTDRPGLQALSRRS